MNKIFLTINISSRIKVYLHLCIIFVFFNFSPLLPCNVPVFRYALERWTADPYRLTVFHKGQIDQKQRQDLDDLRKVTFAGDSTLNLILEYRDLSREATNPFKGRDANLTFPLLMLSYPAQTGIPYPLWLGELTEQNLDLIKSSPARDSISQFLLEEGTAVFLFLESGNKELDQKFYKIVQKEVQYLSSRIKIPKTATDLSGNSIEIEDFQDVVLKFSTIKISRADSSEKIFIEMLLGTESDLRDYRVPMVFPLFGQGRSLYALVGTGINQKTLEKACRSLVDWCSCEIKALHQGVDILFLADWSKRAGESWIKEEEVPPLTGLSEFIPKSDKKVKAIPDTVKIDSIQIHMVNGNILTVESPPAPDTVLQESEESETGVFSLLSKNIGILLLILMGTLAVSSILIHKKVSRVKK